MSSGLANVILFSITAEGIEFEVLLRDISFSRLFKLLFNSLILVRKQFVKYDCLLLLSKTYERFLYCLYLKWASTFKSASCSFICLIIVICFSQK